MCKWMFYKEMIQELLFRALLKMNKIIIFLNTIENLGKQTANTIINNRKYSKYFKDIYNTNYVSEANNYC